MEVSPRVLCVHGEEAVEMELLTDVKVNKDAIVDE
jgi:hypothetical protein